MSSKKEPNFIVQILKGAFSGFFKGIKKLHIKSERVIEEENIFLEERRKKLGDTDSNELKTTKFGIAFSGGGIRSASICLGAVEVLSKQKILQKADYISSVSGGGYTNAYVQASLHDYEDEESNDNVQKAYEKLGNKDFVKLMREKGANYMVSNSSKTIPSSLFMILNVLGTIIIGLINPIIFIVSIVLLWFMITQFLFSIVPFDTLFSNVPFDSKNIHMVLGLFVLGVWMVGMIGYYFFNATLKFYQRLNEIALFMAGLLIISIGITYAGEWNSYLETILPSEMQYVFYLFCGIVFLGFFTNINSISFGRIYGDSLTKAFGIKKSILLNKLSNTKDKNLNNYLAPYPLFNCCLNLAATKVKSKGNLTADYFLLSPRFIGSKMTGYIEDTSGLLSLSRAMSTSAAAINTGMGVFSSGILSIVIGLLNFRMGTLIYNPKKFELVIDLFDRFNTGKDTSAYKAHKEEFEGEKDTSEYKTHKEKFEGEKDTSAYKAHKEEFEGEKDTSAYKAHKEEFEGEKDTPAYKAHKEEFEGEKDTSAYKAHKEKFEDEKTHKKLNNLAKAKIALRIFITMFFSRLIWWPRYYFRSLLSTNKLEDNMLDISDGGHIENLAVFELLKRRCNLILGFDGGMDANYELADLRNLIKRAKNELDIEIVFRDVQDKKAFEQIVPGSDGFSKGRFIIADINYPNNKDGIKGGIFIYAKSSLISEDNSEDNAEDNVWKKNTKEYVKYNYEFPHHSTSDQSFEPVQFQAYFELGQSLCKEILQGLDESPTIKQILNNFKK
ncbi:MAG: hypothetical protein NXI23_26905 [Bacteroidetes bacterium]|nr:hypothetical protein [Bacteroidota bacterium]